jgi:PHD/YefM family antitoxin component YafN of YafNO toxin-antitoxin module
METVNTPEISPLIADKVDEVFSLILEHIRNHGTLTHINQIKDVIDLIITHQTQLDAATSEAASFMTMGQLEQLMLDLRSRLNDANLKALLERLRKVEAEAEIVAQKKTSTSSEEE